MVGSGGLRRIGPWVAVLAVVVGAFWLQGGEAGRRSPGGRDVVAEAPGPAPPTTPPPGLTAEDLPARPRRVTTTCAELEPVPAGTFDERHVVDLAVAGETFVAAALDRCRGARLQLWTSTDAEEWAPLPVPGTDGRPFTYAGVTAVDDRVAVVAQRWVEDMGGSSDARAWTSADGGRTWHETDLAALADGPLHAGTVVAHGRGFVALAGVAAQEPGLWWSASGEAWEPIEPPDGMVTATDIAASRDALAVLGHSPGDQSVPTVAVTADPDPRGSPAWEQPGDLHDAVDAWVLDVTGYPDGLAVDVDPEMAEAPPFVWVSVDAGRSWSPLVGWDELTWVVGSFTVWVGADRATAVHDTYVPPEQEPARLGADGPPPAPGPAPGPAGSIRTAASSADGGATWATQPLVDDHGLVPAPRRLVVGPDTVVALSGSHVMLSTPDDMTRDELASLVVAPLAG